MCKGIITSILDIKHIKSFNVKNHEYDHDLFFFLIIFKKNRSSTAANCTLMAIYQPRPTVCNDVL